MLGFSGPLEWTSKGPKSNLEGGATRGGRSMTIIRKSPSNCCKNCHFLAQTHIDRDGHPHRSSWGKEERDNYHPLGHFSAECAKGIWSTRIDPHLEKSLNRILLENRKDDCFLLKLTTECRLKQPVNFIGSGTAIAS